MIRNSSTKKVFLDFISCHVDELKLGNDVWIHIGGELIENTLFDCK